MFFNDDILFRNGRLALVWRAGALELENKRKRKKKDFQAVVEASLTIICGDIRKLFPLMGTAHGIGLSKMGTLVKGVGVIYCLKIDKLAKDIYDATLMLRRPVIVADARIDAGPASKSKSTIPAKEHLGHDEFGKLRMRVDGEAVGIVVVDNEDIFASPRAFGDIFASPRAMPSRLSDYRASISFGIPSPARSFEGEHGREKERRKRRRDSDTEEAMHDDVIQRLQRFVDVNARAHCLLEDDQPLFPVDEQQRQDLDFGGEQGMLDMLNMGDNVEAGGMEPQEEPLEIPSVEPTVTTGIGMMSPSIGGPPTELEIRSKTLETPPGAGTRPENVKRRRLDREREPDTTVMELENIPERERTRGRIRHRKRLLIDEETIISPKEILDRINTLKAETNMSLLYHRLVETRAPARSTWKTIPRNFQFIMKAGRVVNGAALNDLFDETLSALLRKHEKIGYEQHEEREPEDAQQTTARFQQIPDATIEQERERNASTDIGISAGITGLQGERTAAEMAPPSPQIYDEGYQDRGAMDDGMFQPMDFQLSPRAEEIDPCPFAVPDSVPRRRKDKSVVEDLSRRMAGGNTFQELFPPNEVSRKKAAMGFFMLLKMQAKKDVMLLQDEPYGPIIIEKLNLRSQ